VSLGLIAAGSTRRCRSRGAAHGSRVPRPAQTAVARFADGSGFPPLPVLLLHRHHQERFWPRGNRSGASAKRGAVRSGLRSCIRISRGISSAAKSSEDPSRPIIRHCRRSQGRLRSWSVWHWIRRQRTTSGLSARRVLEGSRLPSLRRRGCDTCKSSAADAPWNAPRCRHPAPSAAAFEERLAHQLSLNFTATHHSDPGCLRSSDAPSRRASVGPAVSNLRPHRRACWVR